MRLHELRAPIGANKSRKRVARGESSGHGKTATRGGKGQTARSGKGKPGLGFEGGQIPMYRRMPKRGFTNVFAIPAEEINLDKLCVFFKDGDTVTLQLLQERRLLKRKTRHLRILGRGEIASKLKIHAHHFSSSAREKIVAAGGEAVDLLVEPAAS